jgi:hypothetical protein
MSSVRRVRAPEASPPVVRAPRASPPVVRASPPVVRRIRLPQNAGPLQAGREAVFDAIDLDKLLGVEDDLDGMEHPERILRNQMLLGKHFNNFLRQLGSMMAEIKHHVHAASSQERPASYDTYKSSLLLAFSKFFEECVLDMAGIEGIMYITAAKRAKFRSHCIKEYGLSAYPTLCKVLVLVLVFASVVLRIYNYCCCSM